MGKLGKKARKFAKKHLQSVLKRRRKIKSITMKRKPLHSRDQLDAGDDQVAEPELSNRRIVGSSAANNTSLDAVFSEDESDMQHDTSDSDGYLSEDSNCPSTAESESETYLEDMSGGNGLSAQNREIHLELEKQKKKLDLLKEKDPGFSKFLESYNKKLESCGDEEMDSDEGEMSENAMQSVDKDNSSVRELKVLSTSCINSWAQLATEQHNVSALAKLLNGYRTACIYGNRLAGGLSCQRIQNSEAFCNILMFILHKADNLFRALLGIPCNNCRKDVFIQMQNTQKWKGVKPLIKSYLGSTLLLLNQVTDSEILALILTRLRASIVFWAAFPAMRRRLIKVSVHLWVTGQEAVSLHSFLIIKDVAKIFGSDCFDSCFTKAYRAFIGHCTIVESGNIKHLKFLRGSFVELCSLDVHKSISRAQISIHQLCRILQQGLQTKEEESLKSICSWQYVSCIDLWVKFISKIIMEYDLQMLLFSVIQIINGVANLFPGPRYFPLRLRCVEWLNCLSSSSGVFIPIASLVLDMLEYNTGKEGGSRESSFSYDLMLKLPKNWLKSQNFQDDCVSFAIELLSVHFAQWSHHISFPDLAIIPLICLRRFYEKTNVESMRRFLKRFIDQVEQNVGYVKKKRDEAAFSPKDQQSVESFLQLEKCSSNASFTQYYKSVMEKALSRHPNLNKKRSPESKEVKKQSQESQNLVVDVGLNVEKESKKRTRSQSADGEMQRKRKKAKTLRH